MSPEQRGALVELARLRAELAEDRKAMARCLDDARAAAEKWGATEPERPWIETALERIARTVDQRVPAGETWHRDLLSQCMTEVPSVRPQVLPRELQRDLAELLEFRHFFRQAYGVNLDPSRLRGNLDRLLRIDPLASDALDLFDRFLQRAQGSSRNEGRLSGITRRPASRRRRRPTRSR